MNNKRLNLWIMLGVAAILIIGYPYPKTRGARSRVATWDLTFKDSASGGLLVLANTRNRTVKYVSIQTSPGESAESVVRRLAETINWNISRDTRELRYDRHILWKGGFRVIAEQNTLTLPSGPHNYALAGTETGLGIPQPPQSLSCSYDKENDQILLRWLNPPGGYDFILVSGYWTDFDRRITRRVPGTSTHFTIDRTKMPVNIEDMDFRIFGFRDNVPSNTAAIHVSGHSQAELYGIPFTNKIAPNWTAWSTAAKIDRAALEQGEKYPNMRGYNPARALLTKPFYQVIKAATQGAKHGVCRKFLGLTPGHTYRITACLSTLEMDSIKGDWSLSLCAMHNGTDGKDLTVRQLAGLDALPDRSSGAKAGRIAFYNKDNTTKRVYAIVVSGDNGAGGSQSSNITLPAGVDTITVWIRFHCANPKGKVGFSGVKLEDISAIKKPKSPAEILDEENAWEVKLLKWIEKAPREALR